MADIQTVSMAIIRKSVIDNLIKQNVSNPALKLLLHIASNQDSSGNIVGIHNKDICDATGLCIQSFYNALYELRFKQIIEYAQDHRGIYEFTILNNSMSQKGEIL